MEETIILSNQVYCKLCKDSPFSKNRHDFVSCKCGHVAVDGGTAYLKRVFSGREWIECSIEWPKTKYDNMVLMLSPLFAAGELDDLCQKWIETEETDPEMFDALLKAADWAKTNGRNMYGLVCAMARTERDGDFHV